MTPSSGLPTYAYLICTECRLCLLLGGTTAGPDRTIGPLKHGMFQLLYPGRDLHHESAAALWRLITEHAGHVLRVVAECWPEFDTYSTVDLTGVYPALPHQRPAALSSDITMQAYARGWPHDPSVPGHRGATPAPGRLRRRDGEPTAVSQFCLSCRIAVDLGDTIIQPDGTATRFTYGSARRDIGFDATANAALLRLLIDHAGHDLLAIPLDSDIYDSMLSWGWILHVYRDKKSIDERGQITLAQYSEGWPEATVHSRFHGMFPVARRECAAGGRFHHDCHHPRPPRMVDLGDTPDTAPQLTGRRAWLRRLGIPGPHGGKRSTAPTHIDPITRTPS